MLNAKTAEGNESAPALQPFRISDISWASIFDKKETVVYGLLVKRDMFGVDKLLSLSEQTQRNGRVHPQAFVSCLN